MISLHACTSEQQLWHTFDELLRQHDPTASYSITFEQNGNSIQGPELGQVVSSSARKIDLIYNEQRFGWLSYHGDSLNETKLRDWVGDLSIALVNQQRVTQLETHLAQTDHIHRIIDEVTSLFGNLAPVLLRARLLRTALELCRADIGALVITEPNRTPIDCVPLGIDLPWLKTLRDLDNNPLLNKIFNSNDLQIWHSGIDMQPPTQHNLDTIATLPLHTGEALKGLIVVANTQTDLDELVLRSLATISRLMAIELSNAESRLQHEAEVRHKREMDIARHIQSSLQIGEVPQIEGADLSGSSLACDETGGDYIDAVKFSDHVIDFIVGDATGHGLGAAMIMVNTRASLKVLMQTRQDLATTFELLNDRMEQDTSDDRFMTLFYGRLDTQERSIQYVSAGHDAPLLLRQSQGIVEELNSTGLPLGMLSGLDYQLMEVNDLEIGDTLLIFSDGIPEARNPFGDALTTEPLKQYLLRQEQASASKIRQDLLDLTLNHIDARERQDDITLMVVRIC